MFKAARSSVPDQIVALKVYFPDQLQERTAREIDALRELRGDTLVRLIDAGTCTIRGHQCVYVATEFVEGEPMDRRLGTGPMSVREAVQVGRDVSAALDLLWSRRIVHRDVKPGNMMLSPTGRVVLIDLGVARHLSLSSLTTAGKTWGTEGYMSPEQMQMPRRLTCKSDMFSLGLVLQECLLGTHPTGRQQMQLANGGPRCFAVLPMLDHAVAILVDGMLTKKPERRPVPSFVVKQCDLLLSRIP